MKIDRIKEIIDDAMSELKPKEYEVIYELFFRNSSVHSLAMKLGVARSTLRYRKSSALRHLKEIILSRISKEEIKELLEEEQNSPPSAY